MTNAEARFNKSLRPRKPEGSLGRAAQDVHLDSHTAPELCQTSFAFMLLYVHGGEMAPLGRAAQDVHLDSHTAPELCQTSFAFMLLYVHGGEMAY